MQRGSAAATTVILRVFSGAAVGAHTAEWRVTGPYRTSG
jgi:hypothetical protein